MNPKTTDPPAVGRVMRGGRTGGRVCVHSSAVESYRVPCDVPIDGRAREFHVSRSARDTYGFADRLFSIQGHVLFADVRAARTFAMRINAVRRSAAHPDRAVAAGDVYAMGLIDEIFHYVIGLYREQYGASVFTDLPGHLKSTLGAAAYDRLLLQFADRFPTVAAYRGEETPAQTIASAIEGVPGEVVVLEEMVVLWLANRNSAYAPLIELFDEEIIAEQGPWRAAMAAIGEWFASLPTFGPDDQTLIDLLRSPAIAHPHDLRAQLEYIRTRWASLVGAFLERLLRSTDILNEERAARFPGGPVQTHVLTYDEAGDDARFSPDREWMPRAVIMAKSTLVWLDQLSRAYGREINTLGAIPDEELDRLAAAGFTGLWLIGLWQRSSASRRIKNLCGNPEAEASAYSLFDYDIAGEIGGWEALDDLRRRLWQRGIRIASDMVPNHTGIDSKWVHEHPEWFVQLPYPPFPGYTFNGENLSTAPGVGIYLEDHYYDRSDAAVVFKRVDFGSGDTRFIYHGNDGTSMPWNDTAQLDYLNPAVRETVIQTILHVARNFPIIRFDAAMTLAKKHIQRLWYPAPGHGGDIPSRSEHGRSQEEFDAAIPVEFWREVVDRVAAEVPDTLLLAEAFWMMESYFVRSLGMHRVYNSAFMNMLKNEENEKYRQTIKNTLEYDPEILKRFVNFMNNPDEETAIAQFGDGDKYFGVCTLMVTMPGLPMFGHGQIEGYAEKYGMEYRRAYWDESPRDDLIARHEREIFPLLHRRTLFAGAAAFRLFDLYDASGSVQANVYAYSNRAGDDRALVFYNNAYDRATGWIHTSSPFVIDPEGSREVRVESLGHALGLTPAWNRFTILHEQRSDRWFIRNSAEIHDRGLYVELNGFESQVFIDIYEVADNEYAHYARLADHLQGQGVRSIEAALQRLLLQPLHDALGIVANSGTLRRICSALTEGGEPVDWDAMAERYRDFLRIAAQFSTRSTRPEEAVDLFARIGRTLDELPRIAERSPGPVGDVLASHLAAEREDISVLVALLLFVPLDEYLSGDELPAARALSFHAIDQTAEWQLIETVTPVIAGVSPSGELPAYWEQLVRVVVAHHNWIIYGGERPSQPPAAVITEILLADPLVESFLQIHVHNGVTWFNREAFDLFADWMLVAGVIHEFAAELARTKRLSWKAVATRIEGVATVYAAWRAAEAASGYRVEEFLAALEPAAGAAATPPPAAGNAPAGPAGATTRKGAASTSRRRTKPSS